MNLVKPLSANPTNWLYKLNNSSTVANKELIIIFEYMLRFTYAFNLQQQQNL